MTFCKSKDIISRTKQNFRTESLQTCPEISNLLQTTPQLSRHMLIFRSGKKRNSIVPPLQLHRFRTRSQEPGSQETFAERGQSCVEESKERQAFFAGGKVHGGVAVVDEDRKCSVGLKEMTYAEDE